MIEILLLIVCLLELIIILCVLEWLALDEDDREKRITIIKDRLYLLNWKKKNNYQTIVHEAGHALIAWFCNKYYDIHIELFSFVKKPKWAGMVWTTSRHENLSNYDFWSDIIMKLGGIAAENVMNSGDQAKRYYLAKDDLKCARQASEQLYSPDIPDNLIIGNKTLPSSKNEEVNPIFEQNVVVIPSSSKKDPLDGALFIDRMILSKGLAIAENIIVTKRDKFEKLISLLFQKDKFSEQELETVLGSRKEVLALKWAGTAFLIRQ
jgi:ATP-dependent Zn protease